MKNNLRDNHLWLSIFARPVQSSFTRLDRLTCCFVLLALSMLINILYYGVQSKNSSSTSSNRLNIGTYVTLTPEQIGTGLMSSLFIFVPSFLLVELFKRIKRRTTRLDNIKSMLNIKTKKSENSNKEMKFPWWFKSFAYLISLLISGISLFFVVIKGIEFGEEKVAKWLTSLFVSFLSSLVLTQPLTVNPEVKFLNSISQFKYFYFILKILLKVIILTCIFKSHHDENEFDNEGDSKSMKLNKWTGNMEVILKGLFNFILKS